MNNQEKVIKHVVARINQVNQSYVRPLAEQNKEMSALSVAKLERDLESLVDNLAVEIERIANEKDGE